MALPRHRSSAASRLVAAVLIAFAMALYGITAGAAPVAAQQSFTFTGSGYGHGVGMSQWGARGWAERGSTYADILRWYYTGTTVTTAATNNDLRVLVAEQVGTFTISTSATTTFAGVGTIGGGQVVTATRNGGYVRLNGGGFSYVDVAGHVDIPMASAGGSVTINPVGYGYRYGTIRVSVDPAGGLRTVIWGLGMQDYLYGLGEMPSSWPIEALKAQATAGRTFAQKRIAARGANDFDLYGSVLHQAYTGTKNETANWRAAVDQTNGVVVTYGGALIDANYSASSGGHTENSENVWVSPLPYLRGVTDPYDGTGGNPNASWSRTYSGAELGAWFGLGTVTSVQVLGPAGVSGRVDKATIRLTGTGGSRDVAGASFRSTVNANAGSRLLMSTKFSVAGAPPPPSNTLPWGAITVATSDGRTVIIGGDSVDPDGYPLVRIVSTMGSQRAVREHRSTNGKFLAVWQGAPGTRTVCVTVYDQPTGQGVDLGCRDILVK
ncbi:MAG: SpoIID/LytB domain-containing protein [Microthrixaceae bacterium]